MNPWVADGNGDGNGAHLFKRLIGPEPVFGTACEWGLDLKKGSSVPPQVRVIGVGSTAETMVNPVRVRVVRERNAWLVGAAGP